MLKGVILLFAYFERILFYGVDGFDDDNDRIENKYPFSENNYEYSDSDDSEDEVCKYIIQVTSRNIAFC